MPNLIQRGVQWISNLRSSGTSTPMPAKPAAPTASSAPIALAHGQSVKATTPAVTLQGLKPGTYTFELVVTDDLGIASPPARITVQVDEPIPTTPS